MCCFSKGSPLHSLGYKEYAGSILGLSSFSLLTCLEFQLPCRVKLHNDFPIQLMSKLSTLPY